MAQFVSMDFITSVVRVVLSILKYYTNHILKLNKT